MPSRPLFFSAALLAIAPAFAQTPLRLDQIDADSLTASRAMADGGKIVCGSFVAQMAVLPEGANLNAVGSSAVYLARFNASGTVRWLQLLARTTTGTVTCSSLAVDSRERIYAIGTFTSVGFFSTEPAFPIEVQSSGGRDIFLAARRGDGRLIWVQTLGGVENEASGGITVKPDGSGLLASGSFRATVDFDPSAATAPLVSAGGNDAFLLDLSLAGDYQWAGAFSGSGASAFLSEVLVDNNGDIYATGFADNGTDLDPGAGSAPLTTPGTIEQVLVKLSATHQFQWFRASSGQQPGTLATAERLVKAREQIIISGPFSGAVDFDPGIGNLIFTNSPAGTAFGVSASAYNSFGDLQWAQQLLASNGARMSAEALSALPDGGVLIGGRFSGNASFAPNGANPTALLASGNADGYFARLNSRGVARAASVISGTGTEAVRTLVAEPVGNFTVGAEFENSVDFDLGAGTAVLTSVAATDGALARYYDDLIYADGYQD